MNHLFEKKDLTSLWTKLSHAKQVVLFGHKNPDGDALGSAISMSLVIKQLGVKTSVIVPDAFPAFYDWMPETDAVLDYSKDENKANAIIKAADLYFFMDFNQYGRIGAISKNIKLSMEKVILIDHHPEPTKNVDLLFSKTIASSTCELVYRILFESAYENLLNQDVATCLLTGMVTDTGGFAYNSNGADFFNVISALIAAGANKEDIFNKVFNNNNESRFRLLGEVLQRNFHLNYKLGVAVMSLSAVDLKKNNYQKGDTEGFVNIPLSLKGINKSVLVTESDSEVKLSFRSQGDYAINGFAEKYFNGGGHRNAAGGHSTDSFDNTMKRLMENLDKL